MSPIYNVLKLKSIRRKLWNNQTDCERILWNVLRNKKCMGYRFLRQYSVGQYVLDFYCPMLRLCIEIDGSQHGDEKKNYDKERSSYLNRQNITVLRFWNNEILNNLEGVYDRIR